MNLLRPYKSDIRQIEYLVKLGCNHADISAILGITQVKLIAWEGKNTRIAEVLKPKARPEFTLLHPDYAPMVEEAFACAGKRYYRFKEEFRMSTGRYSHYYSTFRELELKLSLKDLQTYIDAFKAVLNGGKKSKIEFTELHKLVINLESRIELAFDTTTIKRLAAIAYFDDTEDITSYNDKYGQQKIKLWEENNVYDFFLQKPIGELFALKNISIDYLVELLSLMDGQTKAINSNLQQVLQDNS